MPIISAPSTIRLQWTSGFDADYRGDSTPSIVLAAAPASLVFLNPIFLSLTNSTYDFATHLNVTVSGFVLDGPAAAAYGGAGTSVESFSSDYYGDMHTIFDGSGHFNPNDDGPLHNLRTINLSTDGIYNFTVTASFHNPYGTVIYTLTDSYVAVLYKKPVSTAPPFNPIATLTQAPVGQDLKFTSKQSV